MRIRTYSELRRFETFEDRFEYLKLGGVTGESTLGFDRHIGQDFYHSSEWRSVRQHVILRDNGCDLGIPGHEINGGLLVHHMNPMGIQNLIEHDMDVLNPEYLITTTQLTHNAIHYGNIDLLPKEFVPRGPGDTKLW